jgi:hypothetical protein
VWALIPSNQAVNNLSRAVDSLSPPIKEDFINLVVPNNAGDGRSTRVLELGREIVLKYKANLLRWKKNYSKCGPLFVAFEYIDI